MKKKPTPVIERVVLMHHSYSKYEDCFRVLDEYIKLLDVSPIKGLISSVTYSTAHVLIATTVHSRAMENREKAFPCLYKLLYMNASVFNGPNKIMHGGVL